MYYSAELVSNLPGMRPTLRYTAQPAVGYENVHEARFYPHASSALYLHSHSVSAPFVDRASASSGAMIDIFHDSSCRVTEAKISIAWAASLAQVVTRYRMAAVAWIIGWLAVTVSIAPSIGPYTSERLSQRGSF